LSVGVGILLIGCCLVVGRWWGVTRGLGAQQDLSRSAFAQVTNHQHVVAGSIQKLGQDVARLAGAKDAEDALIGPQALELDTGRSRDIRQNLLQAGVGGFNAQALTIPNDIGIGRLVVDRPVRRLGGRRRDGNRRCLLDGGRLVSRGKTLVPVDRLVSRKMG